MEDVILVDLSDKEIGTMDKMMAHKKPVLHRAFSVFLINGNKILIQKRARSKYHSGGLWANACCSHPRANRVFLDSIYDRLKFELGIDEKIDLKELFSFSYLSKYSSELYEYELDHVLIGKTTEDYFNFNKDEIEELKYVDIDWLKQDLVLNPTSYATWFLICAPKVIDYLKNKQNS